MATNVKHSLVVMRISTVSVAEALDNATAKVLLCEVDLGWDSSASVSTVETKCGNFQVAGLPANTINGNGVVVGDLGSNEVSSQQLVTWANSITKVFFAFYNDADGTIAKNEVVYRTGDGYWSKVGETWNTGDKMGKFSWEFAVNGTIDTTP